MNYNLMGNFEGGQELDWETLQEIKRLEEKIDYFSEKIFTAKMEKRSTKLYETLKKEYTRKLNYLLAEEI